MASTDLPPTPTGYDTMLGSDDTRTADGEEKPDRVSVDPAEGVVEEPAANGPSKESSRPDDGRERVRLVRGDDGAFTFVDGSRLVNNLPWIVGFMELANAGDFAANVWNQVPVPVYAIVFMAIGGTVAGILSVFAFRDARLSCKNVRFLRRQRREQQAERARRLRHGLSTLDVDVLMAVTFREFGSEVIGRWFMDILMGCGAVLICVGTFMAIGGADPAVYEASNILSGYLGNAPIALFGLVNSAWAAYIFAKARGHVRATRETLRGSAAAALVKRRSRNVQVFCAVNGTAAILGGLGSMLTATYWWGYVILIPVIVASVFCNVWWRHRVGYTRWHPKPGEFPALVPAELVAELEFAARAAVVARERERSPIDEFVADAGSVRDVLAFLRRHLFFDAFCLRVASTPDLCDALGGKHQPELLVGIDELLALPESLHPTLLATAHAYVDEFGRKQFQYHERYMAELLGTYYRIAGNVNFDGNSDVTEKQ
ncbi:hypothetical protein RJ55_04282 [Drechmeria coniospora]|nr:hypothetical protein RJ55_04282 [Drechmeria coniospora]